jgi:hypothetical protein
MTRIVVLVVLMALIKAQVWQRSCRHPWIGTDSTQGVCAFARQSAATGLRGPGVRQLWQDDDKGAFNTPKVLNHGPMPDIGISRSEGDLSTVSGHDRSTACLWTSACTATRGSRGASVGSPRPMASADRRGSRARTTSPPCVCLPVCTVAPFNPLPPEVPSIDMLTAPLMAPPSQVLRTRRHMGVGRLESLSGGPEPEPRFSHLPMDREVQGDVKTGRDQPFSVGQCICGTGFLSPF